jgi:putative aminopeptidase FrvX
VLAAALATLALAGPVGEQAYAVAMSLARDGTRPAGGRLERKAHRRIRKRFENAGLRVRVQRFDTAHGPSRNVIGVRDGERSCVRVLMAHADSMPQGPGALDNASGVGLLAGLAPRLEELAPPCTVWLVATGAEEGEYTGSPDHLGATALRRIVPRKRLRYALSLDEVGRGANFRLRSAVDEPRTRVERELLGAARRQDVELDWQRDDGWGHSDHREFQMAGMRGVKLGVLDNACRHTACDTPDKLQPRSFRKVQRVIEDVLRRR